MTTMSTPTSPRTSPRKGKYLECKVLLLDDNWHQFWVHPKSLGHILYEEVCKHLQLLEVDYFDLEYKDPQGFCCWLDSEKQILKQIHPQNMFLKFLVKFYTPDPGLLEEEYTRYLYALQVKRDLLTGAMPCQEHTAVLLASYIVQAELGDFIEDEYVDHLYLSTLKLLPQQTDALLIKIMEHHREHVGQTPEQADFNLLDTARKVELYGIRMHPAKDHEGVCLQLSSAHMGVLVFQSFTKINTFSWAKIRKLSFKRKKFLIKLHPEGYGYYKDTVEFYFESRNECKNFWKKCIEHHAFFRCHSVKRVPRHKTRVVSRGSSFRYSGRTQKQLVEFVRENYVKRPPFESLRTGGSTPGVVRKVLPPGALNRSMPYPASCPLTRKVPLGGETMHELAPSRAVRTTSLRTVSSTRSAAATPRTGTLNSRDISFGRDRDVPQNPSTSSGSHTIDMGRSNENMVESTRVEMAEVHDGSLPRGRRSRSPPRYDRSIDRSLNRSMDRAQHREMNHYNQESVPMPPPRDHYPDHQEEKVPPAYEDLSPQLRRLDPAQFMLSQEDRKLSTPAFPVAGQRNNLPDDRYLPRSPEIENIPERVHDMRNQDMHNQQDFESTPGLHRSQSATVPDSHHPPPSGYTIGPPHGEEDIMPPPPPPPPIYEEDHPRSPRQHPRPYTVQKQPSQDDTIISQSTTSAASMTLTSNMSVTSSRGTEESEDDTRRKVTKRSSADKAYYIAKELLMTERTYRKDLEVIAVWFRGAVSQEDIAPENLIELMFLGLLPIYEFHVAFLKEIEQRLAMWEGKANAHLNGEYRRIGDIILNNLQVLKLYEIYMDQQDELLSELEMATKRNKGFEQIYRDFEAQKVCYLPLNTFLLKPAQRLLHYQLLLERLVKHYNADHSDFNDCNNALTKISAVTNLLDQRLRYLENKQKLLELQRDLVGVDNLVLPSRQFIREGCLQKLSRKGYQQRMFFLFSDMLVYTSRTATPSLQFKVHGQLPLRGMIVEETDPKMAVANSFTIYGGNRCLLVAAGSQEERDKWLEDLQSAIAVAKDSDDDPKILYPSLKSNSSSEALEDSHEDSHQSPERQGQHRANTTMHVCWHRNTSVSMRDHNIAVENQLSGYLLRKFKNSNGWQKLWVVFTNFCLFFYKTYQDDFPLASLPLLGYSVTTPTEADAIHKDYVFKLQFKNHVYFFRAESEYTFERWIEVIQSATDSSRRTRLFSRLESQMPSNIS